MIIFLLLLLAAILAKLGIIAALQPWLRRWTCDGLEAALAAWLVFQSLTIVAFLGLSAFSLLRPAAWWLLLSAGGLALWLARARSRTTLPSAMTEPRVSFGTWPAGLLLLTALLLVAALSAHALWFYDTTDDGLNFGLPRIALWYQQHSVFVRVPPRLFEVFGWEWNSDFNVLQYFLATGRDQACAFASVEAWVVLMLSIAAFSRALGAHPLVAWLVALFTASIPALLYLGMTIKSELLAFAAVFLGLTWLSRALRQPGNLSANVLAVAAFSFAAGCKVTCLPLAGLLLIFLFFPLATRRPFSPVAVLGAGAVAGLHNCRHLVNYLQYGRILDQVSNQPRGLSLAHLVENARGCLSHLFVRGLEVRLEYPLFAGTGLLAVVSLVSACLHGDALAAGVRRWRATVSDRRTGLLLACFAGSAVFFASALPWFAWSFRYYLPWLLPVLLLPWLAAFPKSRALSGPAAGALAAGLGLLCLLHAFAVFRPSEVTPGSTLRGAFAQAFHQDDLDRKLGARTELRDVFRRNLASGGSPAPFSVAVLGGEFNTYFPLFGDNAANPVHYTDTATTLLSECAAHRFDLVAIATPDLSAGVDFAALAALGYRRSGEGRNLLFLRRD